MGSNLKLVLVPIVQAEEFQHRGRTHMICTNGLDYANQKKENALTNQTLEESRVSYFGFLDVLNEGYNDEHSDEVVSSN